VFRQSRLLERVRFSTLVVHCYHGSKLQVVLFFDKELNKLYVVVRRHNIVCIRVYSIGRRRAVV